MAKMAISVFLMVPGVFSVRSCWFFHQMAWFDPLNNSGGVPFDFFDFTYLSIPPIWTIYLYKDMPPPYPHPKHNSGLWNNLHEFGHLQWQWLSRYITKYLKKQASFLSVNTENSEKQTNHCSMYFSSHTKQELIERLLSSHSIHHVILQPISTHIWIKVKTQQTHKANFLWHYNILRTPFSNFLKQKK